jgi:hypothetical protein
VDEVELTVSVGVAGGVTGVVLYPQVGGVTVAGMTEHVSATGLLNPPIAPTVTVEVAEPPGLTWAGLKAEAATLKSFTGRFTVAVCTNPFEVPVTVMV